MGSLSATETIELSGLIGNGPAELAGMLGKLRALYEEVDRRNSANTRDLDLPCKSGCDACCHASVFLTPLEFLGAWDFVQRTYGDSTRAQIVERGLEIYRDFEPIIEELRVSTDPVRNLELAQQLKFRCPLLGEGGACKVYEMRELYARMFGCSFNDAGGIYGCNLVGEHLGGKTVTLLRVRPTAKRLDELPLTHMRQVYPFYINCLYGSGTPTDFLETPP
jgi:hypothetical protein